GRHTFLRGEKHEVDGDWKEQVERGAREHHREPLPERLFVKSATPIAVGDLVLGILPEQLYIASEGDRGQAKLGLAFAKRQQASSESQREALHLHPAQLRHQEVAELVHQHERAQKQDEVACLREVVHLRKDSREAISLGSRLGLAWVSLGSRWA